MDYDLAELARRAGIRTQKIFKIIDPTKSLELELYAAIAPMLTAYRQQLPQIEAQWSVAQQTARLVEAMLITAVSAGEAAIPMVEENVGKWATRVEKWHRTQWTGVVKGALRLDISPILAQGDVREQVLAATKTNVALIKGLSADIRKKIETTVWNAYSAGTPSKELGKQLREAYDFAPGRARFIARDQTAKYADALDQARALQAGLKSYTWRTMGDDHVRPTHKRNNGKTFLNNKPPKITGHPGHEPGCRCKRAQNLFTEAEQAEIDAAVAAA